MRKFAAVAAACLVLSPLSALASDLMTQEQVARRVLSDHSYMLSAANAVIGAYVMGDTVAAVVGGTTLVCRQSETYQSSALSHAVTVSRDAAHIPEYREPREPAVALGLFATGAVLASCGAAE